MAISAPGPMVNILSLGLLNDSTSPFFPTTVVMDCVGARTAIEGLLQSDATLYGATGYIREGEIIDTEVDFETGRLESGVQATTNPYRIYMRCVRSETLNVRAQNEDYVFLIEIRIEGYDVNFETVKARIDDIIERIRYLVNYEMWTGNNLASYYTGTDCKVIDLVPEIGEPIIEDENGIFRVHGRLNITITVNRLTP